MSRPTSQQLEALVEFLELNSGIAKGLLRTAHAKNDTKRKWDDISLNLNALGGAQKTGKGWAKYWADKKCTLKKTCAQHAQSMRRTGGGVADDLPTLSPLDQRLIAIMGGCTLCFRRQLFSCQSISIHVHVNEQGSSQHRVQKQRQRTSTQSRLNQDRELFAAIEQQRVEAETVTARALTDIAQNIANFNTSLESMTAAFREGAQTIANALNNIATAIQNK
ncbi:hypothetical protein ACJJTC_005249 [Scirpophaga incertulas]